MNDYEIFETLTDLEKEVLQTIIGKPPYNKLVWCDWVVQASDFSNSITSDSLKTALNGLSEKGCLRVIKTENSKEYITFS